jgi:hypothetical protein
MKTDKEKFENVANLILKKEYPFIERIEIVRVREIFRELQADVLIVLDIDFIEEHVDIDCYDNMLNDDSIFFSLRSFNHCSDIKMNEKKMKDDLYDLYKMIITPKETLYSYNISISVISYNNLI